MYFYVVVVGVFCCLFAYLNLACFVDVYCFVVLWVFVVVLGEVSGLDRSILFQ